MLRPHVFSLTGILTLACVGACGESLAIPTPPRAQQTSTQQPSTCVPGTDPNCLAVQGSLEGIAFDFVTHAGFAACQDGNSAASLRVLITDSDAPCDGAFITGTSQLKHGNRALVLELAADGTPSLLGAYASDSNGRLVLPAPGGDGNTISDPNRVTNPGDPNVIVDPNSVQDPNAAANPNAAPDPNRAAAPRLLQSVGVLDSSLPPYAPLTVETFGVGSSSGVLRTATFTARHASGATLRGGFAATACDPTVFCSR